MHAISESDFTLYGNQTRNAVCDIFQEIGFCDFPRNWSRGSPGDMSRARIFCLRDRVFFRRLGIIQRRLLSSTGGMRSLFAALILESVRKRWKIDVENPERVSCRRDLGACWAIGFSRTSRRFFCCFRASKGQREYTFAPSLHGSPSPPWFTFSYSAEFAGRRCTRSRLSASLGRRAAFSHRLVVARFSAFLQIPISR